MLDDHWEPTLLLFSVGNKKDWISRQQKMSSIGLVLFLFETNSYVTVFGAKSSGQIQVPWCEKENIFASFAKPGSWHIERAKASQLNMRL